MACPRLAARSPLRGERFKASRGPVDGVPVIEALLVVGGVALLAAVSLVGPLLPATWLLAAGAACTGAGMLLGVPTGLWYHVRLRACLAPRGELPERWWLRPAALHGRLRPDERDGVLVWFYIGGAGFASCVLGCGLVLVGALVEAHRAGVF